MMSTMTSIADALTIERISTADDLANLTEAWNELAGDVPFRCGQWADAWWRHYQTHGTELHTLLVRDGGGELVGVAPWYLSRSASSGRVLRFLGSGEVCSDYLSILCREGFQQPTIFEVARWLSDEGRRQWDVLELNGVAEDDSAVLELCRELSARGHCVHSKPDLSCWRADLKGDWSSFLATLSKSRRERTRVMVRRSFETGRAVVHCVRSEEELTKAFEILIDLHQKRRASLGQPGCFASSRFTAFHRDVARRMLDAGKLRLQWTELDGSPLAVEYGFVGGDTVYYYQGGFDPEKSHEGPGWLSFTGSLKGAIEEGYRYYDFLRGDESYKASWRAEAIPLMQIRVFAGHAGGRLREAAWSGGEKLKSVTRRGQALAMQCRAKLRSRGQEAPATGSGKAANES